MGGDGGGEAFVADVAPGADRVGGYGDGVVGHSCDGVCQFDDTVFFLPVL